MALLNLDIEPATEGLEEFEDSEHKHQDSQDERQGIGKARRHIFPAFWSLESGAKTDRSVLAPKQYRQTRLSRVNINLMKAENKSDPRQRILEVADRLFYAEGVRATGTEKIMSVSEVAKATFYRHFESKDDLVLAYLDQRDRAFWQYLDSPAPPGDLEEALVKIERLVNLPEVTSCPFLRIASEYPDTAHRIHRRVIEHKDRLREYLAELLAPYAVDKNAAAAMILGIIDGALSARMVYGTSKEIPLLPAAEAVVKSFRRA